MLPFYPSCTCIIGDNFLSFGWNFLYAVPRNCVHDGILWYLIQVPIHFPVLHLKHFCIVPVFYQNIVSEAFSHVFTYSLRKELLYIPYLTSKIMFKIYAFSIVHTHTHTHSTKYLLRALTRQVQERQFRHTGASMPHVAKENKKRLTNYRLSIRQTHR